jgi:hypothetical protein
MRGEDPLGLPCRLAPLHPPRSLAGGLMRILGAVVQVPVLAVFHAG